jgi:aspartyl-tRNA(Asn)/glutamyl-tRNA(Gln) amidotransferase subunit A
MCPAAIGSQTVGSIGRPAAFCGVAGLMPTQSRVSRTGVFPVSWSLDHIGPLARSVADIEAMLSAMTETPLAPLRAPDPIRIGVIRDFFFARTTEEARTLTEAALKKLPSGKFEIAEVRLPAIFEMGTPSMMTIMRCEIASAHEGLHRENAEGYGRRLRALVETGMLVDSGSYLRALRIRKQYQREMLGCFRNVSVLITPGALGPAPEGMPTGDPVLSGFWSAADFPTLTIPVALASNRMPLGIQVTAPPLQEPLLFAAGKALEEAIGFKEKPAL